jgi:malonyl-CoA decarboxylase
LSPLPGFCRWLAAQPDKGSASTGEGAGSPLHEMRSANWHEAPTKSLREKLSRAAVHYLFQAKDEMRKPIDPVARFHLGNGARLERLNWMGDASEKGLSEAAGFMVNYLYDLGSVERNHEAYANKDEIVASPEMRRLERALLRA